MNRCLPIIVLVLLQVSCGATAVWAQVQHAVVRLPPVETEHTDALVVPAAFSPSAAVDNPGELGESWAWRKGEYSIVPYGIGWLNMAYETSRTTTGAFSLFVQSADIQGDPSFIVNARATRLGFEITGPKILGADTAGRIEFDFHGQAETENRTGILLRHAYGEFKTENFRLLAGQTWDIISPLNPNTVNYAVGLAAGNIGYRRAQVRYEQYINTGDASRLTLQASIDRSIVSDFAGAPDFQGEDAGWPTLMGRAAWGTRSTPSDDVFAELGVSGHIGQEGVDFRTSPPQDDARFLTWSMNADVRFQLRENWGVQGEFFVGKVLGTFLGGINQGIDPVTRRGIRSIGGWGELWCYWTPQLHGHVGYGIDDPYNADLGFSPAGRRSLNEFLFTNLWLDVTSMFRVGLEFSLWKTKYVELADGQALRVEMAVLYAF